MALIGAKDSTTSRSWSLKVSQIECSSPILPPSGCLQYHTEEKGFFSSFGWNGSEDAERVSTEPHLNSQRYSICFRRSVSSSIVLITSCS